MGPAGKTPKMEPPEAPGVPWRRLRGKQQVSWAYKLVQEFDPSLKPSPGRVVPVPVSVLGGEDFLPGQVKRVLMNIPVVLGMRMQIVTDAGFMKLTLASR